LPSRWAPMMIEHEAFLRWAQSHGVKLQGVAPAAVAEGARGLVAVRDLPADSLLLSVPEACLLTARSARRDAKLGPVLARRTELSPTQVRHARALRFFSRTGRHTGRACAAAASHRDLPVARSATRP